MPGSLSNDASHRLNELYAAALEAEDEAAMLRAAAPLIGAAVALPLWIEGAASWSPTGEAWAPEPGWIDAPETTPETVQIRELNGPDQPRRLLIAKASEAFSDEQTRFLEAAARALARVLALRARSAAAGLRRRVLSSVNHEIRNPLNGIVGSVELLGNTRLDEDQRVFVEALSGSAQTLRAIIEGLRDPVEKEAPVAPEPGPAPARPVENKAPEKFPASRGVRVLLVEDDATNRTIARAMLESLSCKVEEASNGVEAVRCTENMAFDLVLMDRRMPRLDGLAATEIIRARESSTGRRRALIVAMTGDVLPGDREQCLAAGMDDYLSKPVTRDALAAKVSALLEERGGAGRVLVVDDDAINRKVVSRLLESLGVAAVEARGGEEALSLLKEQDFDFVLMDCWMPDRDGVEVTETIRSQGATELPIIALTADGSAENRARCDRAGMTEFLTKPLRRQDVIGLVERYIGAPQKEWDGVGYLAGLGIEGDAAAEVLLEHVASVSARLAELESAIESEDSEAVRFLAHTIAGECGIVGNEDGAEAARALEKASSQGQSLVERRERLAELKALFQKSRKRAMAALEGL